MDAAGGDGAGDFAADDAGEVEADEHVESLAGLLGADHGHVDGAGVFDGFFESGFGDFVEGDAVGFFGEFQDFEEVPRDGFAFAVFIGREPDGVGLFDSLF